MHPLATVLAALAASSASQAPAAAPAPALHAGLVELDERPERVAVLEGGGGLEVLLQREGVLERFRLRGRELVRTGTFRGKGFRPLALDAAPDPAGGAPVAVVVFGDEVRSVDRGVDTTLHAFVLSAGEDGELRPASDDLGGWLRIVGGRIHLQGSGVEALFGGPVRRLERRSGRWVAAGAELPWWGRGLLEATPLPGGAEALAWDGPRPIVVSLEGGARVRGGSLLGDLGAVEEPTVALRVDRPIVKGIDKEGRIKDSWIPLPRRVSVAADGAAYTVLRGRARRFLGSTSGEDAVVRLDWSGGALASSRPYPGVESFVLDFALVERTGRRPAAVLLVNEKEDGSGRAHLVFQEPREDPSP